MTHNERLHYERRCPIKYETQSIHIQTGTQTNKSSNRTAPSTTTMPAKERKALLYSHFQGNLGICHYFPFVACVSVSALYVQCVLLLLLSCYI